jgi:hypothetical protein
MAKTKKIKTVTLGARVTLSEMVAIQERAASKGLKASQWMLAVVRAAMEANRGSGLENNKRAPLSWRDLTEADRIRMVEHWMEQGQRLPPNFREWPKQDRVDWLNVNWPLDPPEMAPVEQTET